MQLNRDKNDNLFKDQEPKKWPTLSNGTYLYNQYKGAPRSAVSKLLPNCHDMLVGRVHIGKVTTGWLSLGFVSLVRLIWKFNH